MPTERPPGSRASMGRASNARGGAAPGLDVLAAQRRVIGHKTLTYRSRTFTFHSETGTFHSRSTGEVDADRFSRRRSRAMHTTSTPDLARPLHEDPRIQSRRWFLLAMMCLSLVLVVMSVSG